MTSTPESTSSLQTAGSAAGGPAAGNVRPPHTTPGRHGAIAALMGFEAVTLAIAATVHLTHTIGGGSRPFNPSAAGTAEALIGVVLAAGASALLRDPAGRGRRVAIAATAFAIVGFLVGLTFIVRGGDTIDVAYHAVMLPLLLGTVIALVRRSRRARPDGRGRPPIARRPRPSRRTNHPSEPDEPDEPDEPAAFSARC